MADESKEKNTHRYNKNVENIDDDSSTLNQFSFKGTKSNTLRIRPNTDFDETQFRCAVTGKNGDVIYSESVKVTQKFNACIIIDFRTGGSPDDTITVKFDKYTPGGVYKSSFTDEIVHKMQLCIIIKQVQVNMSLP